MTTDHSCSSSFLISTLNTYADKKARLSNVYNLPKITTT